MVNAERWELCLRVLDFYDRDPVRREPYFLMRKLVLKAIENFEFLRHRRRPAPGSMRKWLDRNGW